MIGIDDAALFLNTEEFAEDVTLADSTVIRGIYDIADDIQFGGLAEGRDPQVLISTADYNANSIAHRDIVTIGSTSYQIESVEPYGADREYTVIKLRFA